MKLIIFMEKYFIHRLVSNFDHLKPPNNFVSLGNNQNIYIYIYIYICIRTTYIPVLDKVFIISSRRNIKKNQGKII